MRRALKLALVLAWIVCLGVLVQRYYLSPSASSLNLAAAPLLPTEQWMGIYYKGAKVGYLHSRIAPNKSGYDVQEDMLMHLTMMGHRKSIHMSINAALDPTLKLRSFSATMDADGHFEATGSVVGKVLTVELDLMGQRQRHSVELSKTPIIDTAMMRGFAAGGLAVGQRINIPSLDPFGMGGMGEATMEVTGTETVTSMGRQVEAYKIKGSLSGAEFTGLVAKDGALIRQDSSMGFSFVQETQQEAMSIAPSEVDIVAEASVPFNMRLPDGVKYLRLRVSGISPEGFDLNGAGQRYKNGIIEITVPELKIAEGIRPPSIRSPHDVQAVAADIVKGHADALTRALAINQWLYDNIEKTPVAFIPTAQQVLLARQGDCNEHTVLYVALAQAAGLNARMVAGLVHKDGAFYYHAWPEVELDGAWVAVDPTFGQFPADAGHVRLVEGGLDRQGQLIGAMGRIRLEGLEYR